MKYIYGLVDPRTKEIRYIGQTINLDGRYEQHVSKTEDTLKGVWIQELKELGLSPDWVQLDKCENPRVGYLENWWITVGRKQGWNLENSTYPKAGELGNSFHAMFYDQLMARYVSHIDVMAKTNDAVVAEQIIFVKAKLAFAFMSVCSLISLVYALSYGVSVHRFPLEYVCIPILAFMLGTQFEKKRILEQLALKPESYWTMLKDGAFNAMMLAFGWGAFLSIIGIAKLF